MQVNASKITVSGTGKVLLGTLGEAVVGRLLVHIPTGSTINMTFVGRPFDNNPTNALTAASDVILGYYSPVSDTLATAAVTAGQVYVKADGNVVYANVASVTGTVVLTVVPLVG